jgi:predicted metal-dependent enzyme (double-stranded beta helix superfamily)
LPARTSPPTPRTARDDTAALSARLLAVIALDFATSSTFGPASLPAPDERLFERVHLGPRFDIWLIRWGAGSRTALHDHGGSAGAFVVVEGRLVEYMPNPAGAGRRLRRDLRDLDSRPMAPSHVHTVANESSTPATSVHVYSPPLVAMQHYDESSATGAPQPRFREIVDHGTFARE